jgi:peptide/nickel transport system substrate-binding protein
MQAGFKNRATSRRAVLRGAGIGGAGLVGAALIGCGGDDDETSTPAPSTPAPGTTATPGATTAPPAEGPSGGTLRTGALEDITSLEPHAVLSLHPSTTWQTWENLTRYDETMTPQGQLAESWESNDDQSEWTLHLREGVQWHNGREFVSEDVLFNVNRVGDPDLQFGQLRSMAQWFPDGQTPDDRTLVLPSDQPRPWVFDFFEYMNVAAPESLDGQGADLTTTIGTGPFQFQEWRPGEHIILSKNPNYWLPERPLLDEQNFSVRLEAQTATLQFESGALDSVIDPNIRDFVRLRDSGGYQVLSHTNPGNYYCMGINTMLEPFTDNRVRQAMNWSLDRHLFADQLMSGTVTPYSIMWPEASPAYDEAKANHYSLDLEQARQLLDAAGAGEFEMGINISAPFPELGEMAEIWQADLQSIGVNAHINLLEHPALIDAINSRRQNPDAPPNFDGVWMLSSGRSNISPVMHFLLQVTWAHRGGINNTGFHTDEYERLIDELTVAFDPELQQDYYSQINDLILEEAFVNPFANRPPRLFLQENVQDVRQNTIEYWRYDEAWLDA